MKINENDLNKLLSMTTDSASGYSSGVALPGQITLSDGRIANVEYSSEEPDIDTQEAFLGEEEEALAKNFIEEMLQGDREGFVMITGRSDDTLQVKISLTS